jgi:hypothetical protein
MFAKEYHRFYGVMSVEVKPVRFMAGLQGLITAQEKRDKIDCLGDPITRDLRGVWLGRGDIRQRQNSEGKGANRGDGNGRDGRIPNLITGRNRPLFRPARDP